MSLTLFRWFEIDERRKHKFGTCMPNRRTSFVDFWNSNIAQQGLEQLGTATALSHFLLLVCLGLQA